MGGSHGGTARPSSIRIHFKVGTEPDIRGEGRAIQVMDSGWTEGISTVANRRGGQWNPGRESYCRGGQRPVCVWGGGGGVGWKTLRVGNKSKDKIKNR